MKIVGKILCFFMMVTVILNVLSIFNYRVEATTYTEMMDQASGFIQKGEQEANISIDGITSEFKVLGQILTMIGAGVLVAVTTYMGIKYLTAGPDAQAKLKQQLVGVIVSAIVIFGAYGIWKTVGSIVMTFEQ